MDYIDFTISIVYYTKTTCLTTEAVLQLVNLDALGRDEDDGRQQYNQLHLLLDCGHSWRLGKDKRFYKERSEVIRTAYCEAVYLQL